MLYSIENHWYKPGDGPRPPRAGIRDTEIYHPLAATVWDSWVIAQYYSQSDLMGGLLLMVPAAVIATATTTILGPDSQSVIPSQTQK